MEALGINWGFLLIQLVNVGIIMFLGMRYVWGPLVEALEKRKATIEKGLEDARVAAEARANAEKDAEAIKADARLEAQKIVAEARERAEDANKSVREDAEKDAEVIREDARTKAEQEREQLLADMRSQVVSLAMAAAHRLIGASMDQGRQSQIVNDFFSQTPAGVKGMGDKIVVTSALPLNDDEKNRIKNETGAKEAEFTIDPHILGGVIIRAGDKVVDGSVRSSLDAMKVRLG